jgi:hypothetical protein
MHIVHKDHNGLHLINLFFLFIYLLQFSILHLLTGFDISFDINFLIILVMYLILYNNNDIYLIISYAVIGGDQSSVS